MLRLCAKEAVFAVMREIGADAERRLQKSRDLMPRYGEIAAGGDHMREFFPADALSTFLRGLRNGYDPDTAALLAKTSSRRSVKRWNQHRGGDYQTHVWEETAFAAVDRAVVRVKSATPVPVLPPPPY